MMKKRKKNEIPIESNIIDKLYSRFIKTYSFDLTYMDPWDVSDKKNIPQNKQPIKRNNKSGLNKDLIERLRLSE